jgi:Ser/Thr protein kinase RdoA (MazF antagonist)
MAVIVEPKTEIALEIVEQYGLRKIRVLEAQAGYRNQIFPISAEGKDICLAIYKNEPGILCRIRSANAISNYLAANGFPARKNADPRIIRIQAKNSTRFASLYEYLPGAVIPWEAYTRARLKLSGSAMARMHLLLKDFPIDGLPAVETELLLTASRMTRYFMDGGVKNAMAGKLDIRFSEELINRYAAIIRAARRLPGRQPLHMDFVRGNILFSGPNDDLSITGIIDFEKAAAGHRSFDVARSLAFLYADSKYKTHKQVHKSFLVSGYIRGGGKLDKVVFKKDGVPIDLLESLMEFFWMHDFYKFLKHNPYKDLHGNEHYIRTAEILLKRGLLSPAGGIVPKNVKVG